MMVSVPEGVITLEATARSAAILRRMVDTSWWEEMNRDGEPSVNCIWQGNRPLVYLLDFRAVNEKWEALFLSHCPTAVKAGVAPGNLLFMTGNNYRLTPKD